jgi:hypothetical protein
LLVGRWSKEEVHKCEVNATLLGELMAISGTLQVELLVNSPGGRMFPVDKRLVSEDGAPWSDDAAPGISASTRSSRRKMSSSRSS